jgi:diguanylate cyclase (GGDEF)-like protein
MASIPYSGHEGPISVRPPRLVRRFVLHVGLALGAAAIAMVLFARQEATQRAEEQVMLQSRLTADTVLRYNLRPSDLVRPATGRRLLELDQLFEQQVLTEAGVVRVKLYNPAGMVTYSTAHDQIGVTTDPEEIAEVLAGHSAPALTNLAAEGGSGTAAKALEGYVPVSLGSDPAPAGVLELYQLYAPIAASARAMWMPVALVLLVVLAVLYAVMIPLLRRTHRQLVAQLESIRHQAFHDSLTDLPNRELFADRIGQAVVRARREAGAAAVLLIDLDHFKEVNDALGHQSGDVLLRQLADRLMGLVRESDTVARLGGDEFGVVTPATDAAGALELAERICEDLREPLLIAGIELQIDASVGIATFPTDGIDADTLIRHADVALYVSKEIHCPSLYVSEQDHYSPARLTLVTGLRRALERDEMLLHFQPVADVATRGIHGVEALVRWKHPEHGMLGPDSFVPLAENTGLIRLLTPWVIDAALG